MFKLARKLAGLFIVGMLLSGSVPSIGFANSSTRVAPDQVNKQYYHDFIDDLASKPGVARVNLSTTLEAVAAALKVAKSQQEQEDREQEKSTYNAADKVVEHKNQLKGIISAESMNLTF